MEVVVVVVIPIMVAAAMLVTLGREPGSYSSIIDRSKQSTSSLKTLLET